MWRAHELMRQGCDGPFCCPADALLRSVQMLSGPRRSEGGCDSDSRRPPHTQARSPRRVQGGAGGARHVSGIVRVMARSFSYPVHFDSHQANAWVAHREASCNERSKTGYRPDSYGVLTRHRFSTSVIVTLQAPDRDKDPHDLHVWRVRWPALVFQLLCQNGASIRDWRAARQPSQAATRRPGRHQGRPGRRLHVQ